MDSRNSLEAGPHWSEDLARLHCLQTLFPDWTGNDHFLLRQLKDTIEMLLGKDPEMPNTYEQFSLLAHQLREEKPSGLPASHAFIRIDYSGRRWDPLFAREEIIRQLKSNAGIQHILLVVIGLHKALFPTARYRTRAREVASQEAREFIDQLVAHWSTSSSNIHLFYLPA